MHTKRLAVAPVNNSLFALHSTDFSACMLHVTVHGHAVHSNIRYLKCDIYEKKPLRCVEMVAIIVEIVANKSE